MYSADIFFTAIQDIIKNNSYTRIGSKLNISRQTISNWHKIFINNIDKVKKRSLFKNNFTPRIRLLIIYYIN